MFTYYFELILSEQQTEKTTMLFYGMAEDLVMKFDKIVEFHRTSESSVTVVLSFKTEHDGAKAQCYLLNALRLSKWHCAHTCAVTML